MGLKDPTLRDNIRLSVSSCGSSCRRWLDLLGVSLADWTGRTGASWPVRKKNKRTSLLEAVFVVCSSASFFNSRPSTQLLLDVNLAVYHHGPYSVHQHLLWAGWEQSDTRSSCWKHCRFWRTTSTEGSVTVSLYKPFNTFWVSPFLKLACGDKQAEEVTEEASPTATGWKWSTVNTFYCCVFQETALFEVEWTHTWTSCSGLSLLLTCAHISTARTGPQMGNSTQNTTLLTLLWVILCRSWISWLFMSCHVMSWDCAHVWAAVPSQSKPVQTGPEPWKGTEPGRST